MADLSANPAQLSQPVASTDDAKVQMRKLLDSVMQGLSTGGALSAIVLLIALTFVLFSGAMPAISKFGFKFLTSTNWDPVQRDFGALPFVYGTFITAVLALLIAVPMSIGAALFLTRIAPKWLSGPVSFLIELLAAVPSIVYGFWGVAWLVPTLQGYGVPALKWLFGSIPYVQELVSGPAYGSSILAAGMVLAIMIMPIITAVSRDVLLTVPRDIEEGAYALGATWWQSAMAILNFGKLGIFGAIILGFARAIGETMAVAMVIGNSNDLRFSLLAPGQTMASLLANEFQNADNPMYLHSLVYLALVLLVMTVVLNGIARILVVQVQNAGKSRFKVKKTNEAANVSTGALPVAAHMPSPSSTLIMSRNGPNAVTIATPMPVLRDISIAQINYFVRYVNVLFKGLCIVAAIAAISFLLMIFGFVLFKGFSSLSWEFFTKNPGAADSAIGMKNCIVGTLILVGLASVIGVPMGMLCGIYLSEYAKKNWFSDTIRMVVDVLAGTPSIIVGVLAYQLIISKEGFSLGIGPSGWGGAMALAFLMIPIIARTTEEMLHLVPDSYREASLALGGSKYQTILFVILPAATTGIVTGIMLSIARVAGETAPLIFTALGSDQDVYNPSKPFPALTLKIYQYAQSAEPKWIEQAWAGMLVLIFMITILSVIVRYVTRAKKQAKH